MQRLPTSLKPLAALLAAAGLLALALPARATVVMDGLYAEALAKAGDAPLASDGPYNTLPMVSAYTSASHTNAAGGTSYAWSSSFGSTSGAYGVGSDGQGVFDSQSLFTRTWNITNDTATAMQYSFSFYVYGGSMRAESNGATGSGWSSYLLDINLGSTDLFNSSATINSDGSYTETGTRLTHAQASGTTYYWGGTTMTLDLGVFNPGESKELSYDMVSHSMGDYGFDGQCSGYGYGDYESISTLSTIVDDGYGGYGCYLSTGVSSGFTGDPSGLSGTPLTAPTITARAANDVPEPGSLALLGLGLTVAVALRPRRRQSR